MCMVLIMHAAALLRSHGDAGPIAADDRNTRFAAWTISAIPRAGVTIPF